MKRLVVAAMAAAAAVVMTAPSFAAPPAPNQPAQSTSTKTTAAAKERSAAGVVASYSADTRTLKLQSGSEFKLASGVTTFPRQGERVTVQWKHEGKERIADGVTVAP